MAHLDVMLVAIKASWKKVPTYNGPFAYSQIIFIYKTKKNHFITQTYGGLCDRMRPRAASEFTLPYLNYEIDLKVFFIKKNN